MRAFFVGLAVVLSSAHGAVAADAPPNIVILFADDLGYGDLGCFGHPTIKTPTLDRMATEGLKLTSFYAMPSCSPARAALLTGKYPTRVGVPGVFGPEETKGMFPKEVTIAEALKELGYQTGMAGKWHLGHEEAKYRPLANGFDSYFGLLYSNDMIKPWVQTDRPLQLWRNDAPIDEAPVDQTTLTTRYTKEAVDFIERAADDGPFFFYLAYSMVHVPIFTAPEFRGKSAAGLFGDVVETIDWSVGQVLGALKNAGVDDNTLVIFTSDNGPWQNMPPRMFSENKVRPQDAGLTGPLRGWKGGTYEGGIRVPGIVRWPGVVPAGSVSSDMAALIDVLPTCVSVAGGTVPESRAIDGIDLTAFFKGESPSPREEFVYYRGWNVDAVRQGPWKLRTSKHRLTETGGSTLPELFHLGEDPGEMYNMADAHPDLVESLSKRIESAQRDIEALRARD